MGRIKNLKAREILDSRGNPTLEGQLELDSGLSVSVQIPSGTSKGPHEGVELRDKDIKRYNGNGVLTAAAFINNAIGSKLAGVDVSQREDIDAWLLKADGTEKHERLGVNTILTISMLLLKAQALEAHIPLYQYINQIYNKSFESTIQVQSLPSPIFNMINGGLHGSNNLNFQEFHIIPSTSTPFPDGLIIAQALHSSLFQLFKQKNIVIPTSDEGGYMPSLPTNTEAFDALIELSVGKKYKMGLDVFTGVDCAADSFYKDRKYTIRDKPTPLGSDKYVDFILELAEQYSILVIEDPLSSDDFDNWQRLVKQLGDHIYIIADDLIGGSKKRLEKAISLSACNVISIKLNQVATVTEMFSLIATAKKAGIKIMVSQRMNETNDDFIADLAVGIQADFVKFGSPYRGERIAKYNRLLQIYSELTKSA